MGIKHTTLSPTLLRVLEITKMNVPVTPAQINDHIGNGNYASKHILYLKILGYDFVTNKDGRSVVSYTLVKEPDNVESLRGFAINKKNKVKTPKVSTKKTVKLTTIVNNVSKDFAAKKSEDEIKAKNLETMRKVAAKMKGKIAKKSTSKKKVREFDDVTEQFGTSGEVGTSFSVERDWDSVDGLDLAKLL